MVNVNNNVQVLVIITRSVTSLGTAKGDICILWLVLCFLTGTVCKDGFAVSLLSACPERQLCRRGQEVLSSCPSISSTGREDLAFSLGLRVAVFPFSGPAVSPWASRTHPARRGLPARPAVWPGSAPLAESPSLSLGPLRAECGYFQGWHCCTFCPSDPFGVRWPLRCTEPFLLGLTLVWEYLLCVCVFVL